MNVLIANPPWFEKGHSVRAGSRWPHAEFDEKEDRTGYAPFPFFMAYAAAVLERDGHEVGVLDALTLGWSRETFMEKISEFKPDFVIMESSTPSINFDLRTAQEIKDSTNAKVALAGPHVTTFAADILNENKQVDYIFLGEYEMTCGETIKALERGTGLKNVLGLAYRENGSTKVNQRRPLADLDELPFPARHLFQINRYCEPFSLMPNVQLIASRGCTFGCVYCLWPPVMYGGRNFRFRKPEKVVEEMGMIIKKYNPKELYFDDDTFNLVPKKVEEFCKTYKESSLNRQWVAMCSPVNMTKELLTQMRGAGCEALKFGVESGSEDILRKAGRTAQRLSDVKNVFKWCKELGIRTHATFMIGLPGETRGTVKKTFNHLLDIRPDSFQVSVCTPLPGTEYYNVAKDMGYIRAKKWEDYSNIHFLHDNPVVRTEELTQEDLKKASEYANNYLIYNLYFKKFLLEPKWAAFKLGDTFRRHGLRTFKLLSKATSRVARNKLDKEWI